MRPNQALAANRSLALRVDVDLISVFLIVARLRSQSGAELRLVRV